MNTTAPISISSLLRNGQPMPQGHGMYGTGVVRPGTKGNSRVSSSTNKQITMSPGPATAGQQRRGNSNNPANLNGISGQTILKGSNAANQAGALGARATSSKQRM